MTTENKYNSEIDFFNDLNYEIFRDFSKPAQKGHILFSLESGEYIKDLSNFDLYDYLRDQDPLRLANILLQDLEPQKVKLPKDNENLSVEEITQQNQLLKNIAKQNEKIHKIKSVLDDLETQEDAKIFLIKNHEFFYSIFKDIVNFNKIIVNGTDYKPVVDRVFKSGSLKFLNLYKMNDEFSELKPNRSAPFPSIEFITKNIAGSEKRYNYLINFLAYKIQNPLDVPPCHIIIRDDGGTGKSDLFLGDILERLFKVNVVTQTDLMSGFNSFMVGSSLIWCEEVEGFEDEKKLKALTGAKYLTLNEKFEKNKKVKNYNNFIVVSNELRVMKITEKDRRWSIIGGGKRLVPLAGGSWDETAFKNQKENERFFKQYHKNLDEEIKNFYSYLLSVPVTRSMVQVPLDNKLKNELIDLNKSSEFSFIDDLKTIGISDLIKECYGENSRKIEQNFIFYHGTDNEGLLGYWCKLQDLYNLYVQFCLVNQYSKKLSKKMFLKRLERYKEFSEVFSDYQPLKVENVTCRCLKLKTPKNNPTIEPIEVEIDELE